MNGGSYVISTWDEGVQLLLAADQAEACLKEEYMSVTAAEARLIDATATAARLRRAATILASSVTPDRGTLTSEAGE